MTITEFKDLSQIGFFLLTGTLAVLTFLQAKKTFFTPFKTEAFKIQLKALGEVLAMFDKRPERWRKYHRQIGLCFQANYYAMMVDYEKTFYTSQEALAHITGITQKLFEGCQTSSVYVDSEGVTPPFSQLLESIDSKKSTPSQRLAVWAKYRHEPIHVAEYLETCVFELETHINSPLLPSRLRQKLSKVRDLMVSNISLIGHILTRSAADLPAISATWKDCNGLPLHGIHLFEEFMNRITTFDQAEDEVLAYINFYLESDSIIPKYDKGDKPIQSKPYGMKFLRASQHSVQLKKPVDKV